MNKYSGKLPLAVAAQLRAERAANGMTQKELAEKAGLGISSVQRYLNGQRAITLDDLAALSHALGFEPEEIISRAVDRFDQID